MAVETLKRPKRARVGNGKKPKPPRAPSRTMVALELLNNRPWWVGGAGWMLSTRATTAAILNDLVCRELAAKTWPIIEGRARAFYSITDKGRRILALLKKREKAA